MELTYMSNLEKYQNAFKETFLVDLNVLPELKYQSINEWDSVGHMGLMAALEETFEVEFEIDDIIDFSSFNFGKTIMAKYDIEIG
jgi:acyl carrier protein